MTQTLPSNEIEPSADMAVDWLLELTNLSYAYGEPKALASLKLAPSDFQVIELMDIECSGEGEHFWLDISKTKCNTDAVAKQLARHAGVAYKHVSYSGMKDYFAETRQWFSVWMPRGPYPEWSDFDQEGVLIHKVVKHSRKLRRGSHRANQFCIVLRDVDADTSALTKRLEVIKQGGVPNYFGPQRFGRGADNMRQALQMLVDKQRVKNKSLRGLLLSSARAWLFNQVVSARVQEGSWNTLKDQEPANLQGSNSVFSSEASDVETRRLNDLDIHPTAPMWGDNSAKAMQHCDDLHHWEQKQLSSFNELMQGLEDARLDYSRRPTRSVAINLEWQFLGSDLHIDFELNKGQFATSIIRELVQTR